LALCRSSVAGERHTRSGMVRLLSYNVLLHIDHITDFRPPVERSAEWPQRHSFCWRLGLRDDHGAPHRLVQDHLGPRKRDRSLPGGGGVGASSSSRGWPTSLVVTEPLDPSTPSFTSEGPTQPTVSRTTLPAVTWCTTLATLQAKAGPANLASQANCSACA
jgi:hypothetical protein